jgi:hypothetical protein
MKAPLCAVLSRDHWLSLRRLMKEVCSAQKAIEIASASGEGVLKSFCHPHFHSILLRTS